MTAALVDWAESVPLAYENRELRGNELPAAQFLVNGRIPYGLWTHCAPAGGYKSAFASQFEHHIAYRTPIPGLDWQFAQYGDCLVIAPDETAYETQERSFRILPGGNLPTDGAPHVPYKYADIHVRHEPHGDDLKMRITWLWREIELLEKATGRHIVWIRWDTLGNLLGDKNGADAYTHSQPLQQLNQQMANTHRVMFCPNHVGKDGRMIGSVNVVGCSNLSTTSTITKTSLSGVITCLEDSTKMRGGPGWEASVVAINGLLHLEDKAPAESAHLPDSMPQRVAAFLAQHGPATIGELRAGTHLSDKPLWKSVLRMRRKGELRHEDGRWILEETGAVAVWPATWVHCQSCPCLIDPDRGCVNIRCKLYRPEAWTQAAPEPTPVQAVIPEMRAPADAVAAVAASVPLVQAACAAPAAPAEPTEPPSEPLEPVPQMSGNEAVDKLIELVKASGLYAKRKIAPEFRAKFSYENVCVGGAPNTYMMRPAQAPAFERVLIIDRKSSYYQSCAAWYVPNILHREGNLDYEDIVLKSYAGMFEILYTPWEGPAGYPDPLGGHLERRKGDRLIVPRATLDRAMQLVGDGLRRPPEILCGWVGKGTERGPLQQWGKWCLEQRRAVSGPAREALKDLQNKAFGTLRIADPDKQPGPVDRPDWQYAVTGHHYATLHRHVWNALNAGEPVVDYGNTDEIIFGIPDDAPAELTPDGYRGWLPPSMVDHIDAGRFAVKDVRATKRWYVAKRSLNG